MRGTTQAADTSPRNRVQLEGAWPFAPSPTGHRPSAGKPREDLRRAQPGVLRFDSLDCVRQMGRHVLAYFVLPNFPFWAAGALSVTIPRAGINLDYLVVGLAALYISNSAGMVLLIATFLVDVLISTASYYYFSQHDLISSARYLIQLPWGWTLATATVLLTAGLTSALSVAWLAGPVSLKNRPRVSFALSAVLSVLIVSGVARWAHPDSLDGHKLATSTYRRLLLTVWHDEFGEQPRGELISVPSATDHLREGVLGGLPFVAPGPRRNVVLVLVESYGLMNDPESAAKLEAPFYVPAIQAKYRIRIGTMGFHGPTVAGEFRALCGLQMDVASSQLVRQVSGRCLPELLEKQGYHTTAIHGFRGIMFDRQWWYKGLGFEDTLFLEDLRKRPGMHMCGGIFPGICDDDIAELLRQKLVSSGDGRPQFFYWLTLNSHLPVQRSSASSGLLACGSGNAANPDLDICNWMALIYKVNKAIAELCANPRLPSTEFIVVGDHAPPFLTSVRRNQFSQTVVPFIDLMPEPPSRRQVQSPEFSLDHNVSVPMRGR
jgi:sulfatase-like protein